MRMNLQKLKRADLDLMTLLFVLKYRKFARALALLSHHMLNWTMSR
jgi:hypothetical protein